MTDWEIKTLGEVGEALIGLTYSPEQVSDDGVLVLRSSNIRDGQLSLQDTVRVHAAIPEKIRVRESDILICARNGSRQLIGKSLFLDKSVAEETFGAFMAVFRSPMNAYLRYFFESDSFKRQVDEHLGATINQITNASLRGFKVSLPGKSQRDVISARLEDVDALVRSIGQLIAKKRDIKQGMMQELLAGCTRLPGFGDSWKHYSAGEVGIFKGGSGFPVHFQGKSSGQYPFFKVSDMNTVGNELFMTTANNYISNDVQRQIGANVMPRNSIVFAKVGAAVFLERKRILAAPSCIDNNMAAFTVDVTRADVRFVHYALMNFPLTSLVATGALPSLNGRQLRSVPLDLPVDLDEQRAIARVLGDADNEIAALERRLQSARAIKTGMMQELLTGRTRLPAEAAS